MYETLMNIGGILVLSIIMAAVIVWAGIAVLGEPPKNDK